jgi:hypothetical protein
MRADKLNSSGQPVSRWYEWKVAPRNVLDEKNRM